jgi:N-acetylglucosamine-6-sulfatase
LNSAVATMAATVVKTAESKPRKRPNVVFILADDQRWDCMSCAGHPLLKTPNMDRLAVEGARFTNAFSTTALTSLIIQNIYRAIRVNCRPRDIKPLT